MKFSKQSNRMIFYIMGISIFAITLIAYIAITTSMKNIYLRAMDDMNNVAIHNLNEHIALNQNEISIFTRLQSFTDLIVYIEEKKQDTSEYKEAFAQNFNYIQKKTENSTSIKRILVANKSGKIILSNYANEIGQNIAQDTRYMDNVNDNISTASITTTPNNENIIVIAQPIRLYNRTTGYAFMEISFDMIDSLINNYKFGDSGNLFLITSKNMIIGKDGSLLPNSVEAISDYDEIANRLLKNSALTSGASHTSFNKGKDKRYMVYAYIDSLDAIVASSISSFEIINSSLKTSLPLIFLLAVVFILLGAYRYIISKKILHPLSLLNRSLYLLKKGNLRARFNYNADNELGNLSTVFNQTISNLQQTTLTLRERETKSNIILESITDVVWEYNIESEVVKLPESWSTLISSDAFGTSYQYPLQGFLSFFKDSSLKEFSVQLDKCIVNRQPFEIECQLMKQNGEYFWAKLSGSCMYNEFDEPYKVIGSIFDITSSKQRELELQDSAKRDDMTKLYKKVEMEKLVNKVLSESTTQHMFMIIDLDNFKQVNDTFGHIVGDEVIIHTSELLRRLCTSRCHICRFGGDEFTIFSHMPFTEDDSRNLAIRVQKEINKNYITAEGHDIILRCSIGVAMSSESCSTYSQLLTKADAAVYYIKENGKNNYKIYDSSLDNF